LKILLLVEAIALVIALVVPLTPSKTGGDVRLGKYFFAEPTYLHEVLVGFVLVNGIIMVFAIAFWIYNARNPGDE
jgi:hypothetical protein